MNYIYNNNDEPAENTGDNVGGAEHFEQSRSLVDVQSYSLGLSTQVRERDEETGEREESTRRQHQKTWTLQQL
jgi:hypothetical protein